MVRPRPRRGTRLRCRLCYEAGKPDPWYEASEFYVIRRRPDGSAQTLDCYCKACRKRYSAECNRLRARYDPAFREKHRRRSRRRKAAAKKELAGELRARREETTRLVRRLMELRWRQSDIGRAIGRTQCTISHWARGQPPRNGVHLKALRRLVRETEDGTIAPPVPAHRRPVWLRGAS